MSERNDGGQAFPLSGSTDLNGSHTYPEFGMTLRDWFAGQALTGLLAEPQPADGEPELSLGLEYASQAAKAAYRIADAMLAERAECGGAAA